MRGGPGRSGWAKARFHVQRLFDDDPHDRFAWVVRRRLILLVVVSVTPEIGGRIGQMAEQRQTANHASGEG